MALRTAQSSQITYNLKTTWFTLSETFQKQNFKIHQAPSKSGGNKAAQRDKLIPSRCLNFPSVSPTLGNQSCPGLSSLRPLFFPLLTDSTPIFHLSNLSYPQVPIPLVLSTLPAELFLTHTHVSQCSCFHTQCRWLLVC